MEFSLKLLSLNKLFKKKSGSRATGSSGKKHHDQKDDVDVDNMVFSESSEQSD
jgi:hypothetical protein